MSALFPLPVVKLPHAEGLPLPSYQTPNAAGLDLLAAINAGREIILSPGERALVPSGLEVAIPQGYEGQIRPRSGLALKHGVTVLNSPGTIDADYRGEIGVLLINHGREPFTIRRGDRIGQLVLSPVALAVLVLRDTLDATARGAGGFGSTGTGALS